MPLRPTSVADLADIDLRVTREGSTTRGRGEPVSVEICDDIGFPDHMEGLLIKVFELQVLLWKSKAEIPRWPELLSKFLQMVWCAPISGDDGEGQLLVEMRLLPHPDVVCWSYDHLSMAVIACSGLFIWCLATPLVLFHQIYRLKDMWFSSVATARAPVRDLKA